MKKLLTLVLALVLVFAIAAPALAITGDVDDNEEDDIIEVIPAKLAVELFTAGPEISGFGGFKLSPIAANKAYIVNEVAYYGVALQFINPDEDEDEAVVMPNTDYLRAKLTLESDAIALEGGKIKAYVFDEDDNKVGGLDMTKFTMEDNEWLVANGADTWKSGNTVYFFGHGIVEDKGVLTAELAKVNKVGDVDHPLVINDSDGEEVCSVWSVNAGFVVNVPGDGNVLFTVDGDDEVTKISVKLPQAVITKNGETYPATFDNAAWKEVVFKKVVSGGGEVIESVGDYKGKDLTAAKALYADIMEFFGFDYDAEGVLLAKHFEAKASGLYMKDEVAIQLYTAAIVVPGGVEPPKTGDAATVIGFVMIAVAMIAAGVVVSRKVRA
jgi:hypothetical protein